MSRSELFQIGNDRPWNFYIVFLCDFDNPLDQIVSEEQTSPTLFSHSVFNAAAGYLTRIFNLRGNTSTLTDFYYPFFQALAQGCTLINSGRVKRCFVLQVETYSRLLQDAKLKESTSEKEQWPMGAVAWLLEEATADTHPLSFDSIIIESTPNWENDYLDMNDTLSYNGETVSISHPLAAPLYLSAKLENPSSRHRHHFNISGNNGTIELQFNH